MIDNATFYFLIFLVRIWWENSISVPIRHGIIYFQNMTVWWGYISRRGKGRDVEGVIDDKPPLISHHWYVLEKRTVPSSSNLNLTFSGHIKRFGVTKIKEKCVTFCFIKLNKNVSSKSSGEGWLLCAEVKSLLQGQYLLTLFSANHEIVEKKNRRLLLET